MSKNVKKAIIPVAGRGTRFLPATKAIPKEIIPILKVPMIHYIVEEAISSGIEQIVFVTSSGKEAIENYFDVDSALELFLSQKEGKEELLEMVQKISKMAEISTIRQKEQLGLGHAVLQAKSIIGDSSFAVLLGDDMMVSENPVTGQLIDQYQAQECSAVLGILDVPLQECSQYGMIQGEEIKKNLWRVSAMVEKPYPEKAPSTKAVPGRYVFSAEIFECLESIPRGAGGEYQLTDAIQELAGRSKVMALEFEGKRYDTGSQKGYFEATLDFALKDDKFGEVARALMTEKLKP